MSPLTDVPTIPGEANLALANGLHGRRKAVVGDRDCESCGELAAAQEGV